MKSYSEISEHELIKMAAAKDERAQWFLFRKYASKMLSVCMRYSDNRAEAEDVLQEGFITVFEKISQFKGEGSFEGWVRSIMVRRSLRNWRKSKLMNAEPIESFHLESDSLSIIDQMFAKELIELINSLPDGYRLVFNLFVVDGYSHAEIASMLNIKESTSRSQLVKARMLLQKLITASSDYLSNTYIKSDENER